MSMIQCPSTCLQSPFTVVSAPSSHREHPPAIYYGQKHVAWRPIHTQAERKGSMRGGGGGGGGGEEEEEFFNHYKERVGRLVTCLQGTTRNPLTRLTPSTCLPRAPHTPLSAHPE